MFRENPVPSFPGAAVGREPGIHNQRSGSMDSGFASASRRRPGMTRLTRVDTLAPRVLTQAGLERSCAQSSTGPNVRIRAMMFNKRLYVPRGNQMRAISAAALSVLLAGIAIGTHARADDYPARSVHIIVGFIPGSAADITARVLGNGLSRLLGQQFVVENKPGAGSSLAGEFSARAPKDGYTLFLGSSANIANQVIAASPTYDMTRDFAPIALATTAPVILVVHPSTGV